LPASEPRFEIPVRGATACGSGVAGARTRAEVHAALDTNEIVYEEGLALCGSGGSTMNHSEIVGFLWGVADLIRDTFRRGKYQDVILPLTMLRRLDCVLAATKGRVLARQLPFAGERLARAIAATFVRRRTAIEIALPTALTPRFYADAARPGQWRAYLTRNALPGAPADWTVRRRDAADKAVTHAALKTIAAFLNTDGGDLLIGVADDGAIVGIERDQLENDDKFMRHLAQVVRNGLGDRAGTCIDPKPRIVEGKAVCVVSCQRSPEPVFLKWKGFSQRG
jgi:hypothetical protein